MNQRYCSTASIRAGSIYPKTTVSYRRYSISYRIGERNTSYLSIGKCFDCGKWRKIACAREIWHVPRPEMLTPETSMRLDTIWAPRLHPWRLTVEINATIEIYGGTPNSMSYMVVRRMHCDVTNCGNLFYHLLPTKKTRKPNSGDTVNLVKSFACLPTGL
jgi:hypothetical protein